jgi:hypothetical protein
MALKKNPALAYYKEGANKAAPTFNNTTSPLRLLRLVSEDLKATPERDESNEVRGDAQSSGSVITGVTAAGSIQLQYSLDTYDDLIVGMLYAPDDTGTGREDGWQQDGFTPLAAIMGGGAGAVTFNATNMTFTSAALFTRVPAAGERIYVTGFGNKNLDTVFTVAAGSDSSTIELENDTGAADIAAYAGVSADVVGTGILLQPVRGYTRNGTYDRKFGLVRFYSDTDLAGTASATGLAATDWRLFRGAVFTSIQLAVAPGSAGWTGTLSVLFSDENVIKDATSAANIGGFQITNWDQVKTQNTYSLADAIKGVVMVRLRKIGDAVTASTRLDPLSFTYTKGNNAQEVRATRNRGAIDVNQGTFSGNLSFELLYVDPTYAESMEADDAYEVEVAVADAEGHCQVWRFPKARFTAEAPNPGKNNPVTETLAFITEAGGDGFALGAGNGRQVEILRFYDAA